MRAAANRPNRSSRSSRSGRSGRSGESSRWEGAGWWDGVGTDIVSVERIARLMRARGRAFLERWFTDGEIAYCVAMAGPSRHFAARHAAKEAVLKAVPVRWEGPLPWRSIEIVHDEGGAPAVRLSGDFGAAVARAGVCGIRVSLAHCDEFATAVALVQLGPGPTG